METMAGQPPHHPWAMLKLYLYGYEFKWRDNRKKPPKDWLKTYSNATYDVVTPNQYLDFVT